MDKVIDFLVENWLTVTVTTLGAFVILLVLSVAFYRALFKRFYDVVFSGLAIIVLSPVLIILTILGAINMKGNPFFTQLRPGKIDRKTKEERIFKLIKFRTMTCEKDQDGNLLPDEQRLTKYGKFLRSTSLDELPELINIFIGDMSIIGPRPLLVKYLPLYSEEQRKRHNVRPGLTGLAQINGRNAISWDDKFKFDVDYVHNVSLFGDILIIVKTVLSVLKREGINSETSATMEEFKGNKEHEWID